MTEGLPPSKTIMKLKMLARNTIMKLQMFARNTIMKLKCAVQYNKDFQVDSDPGVKFGARELSCRLSDLAVFLSKAITGSSYN